MNVVAVHSFQPIPLFVFMALDQFYNTQEKEIVSGGFCLFVCFFLSFHREDEDWPGFGE